MEIIYIALLTIIAGGVGTISGFGTSTIMIPILLFFFPLPQTLLLVGVIHWFVNVWRIAFFKKGFDWSLVLVFGIAGIVMSYLGARIVFAISETILSRIVGGFLIAYVIFLFLKPKFKIPKNSAAAVSGGALSGFFAGIFGVGGPMRSLFLSAFDLPKAVYISTTGAIALFIDSTRIATYIRNGARLNSTLIWGFLLFIPATILGAAAAKKIVNRVPQNKFRLIIALFLLAAGVKFLFFPGV